MIIFYMTYFKSYSFFYDIKNLNLNIYFLNIYKKQLNEFAKSN